MKIRKQELADAINSIDELVDELNLRLEKSERKIDAILEALNTPRSKLRLEIVAQAALRLDETNNRVAFLEKWVFDRERYERGIESRNDGAGEATKDQVSFEWAEIPTTLGAKDFKFFLIINGVRTGPFSSSFDES